jgi:hypothetical protein
MLRKYLLIVILFALGLENANAQFSDIRGTVQFSTNDSSELSLAFVQLYKEGSKVSGRYLNDQGGFIFNNITSGDYKIIVKCIGYSDFEKSFYLEPNESKFILVSLRSSSVVIGGAGVIGSRKLDVGNGGGPTIKGKELIEGARTSVIDVIAKDLSIVRRGNRTQGASSRMGQLSVIKNNTTRIGPTSPTILDVEGVRTLSSGVPAMYGDFVGGAVEYNSFQRLDTVSRRILFLRSSSLFNPYHQNAMESYWYKPLKVVEGETKLSAATSFYFDYNKDPNPSYVQLYALTNEDKTNLLNDPFATSANGTELPRSNQFTNDQFDEITSRKNAANGTAYAGVLLNWKTGRNVTLRLEPTFHYSRGNSFSFSNSLLNSDHNPLNISKTTNVNFQVMHRLKTPYNKKGDLIYDSSLISKINYVVIADYQRLNSETKDPIHQDNIFNYGHIGTYSTRGRDIYSFVEDELNVVDQNGNSVKQDGYYRWMGYQDTGVTFNASSTNPYRAAITSEIFKRNHIQNLTQLSQEQGLLNGQNATAIHSMWYAPGTIVTNYRKSDVQKASLSAIVEMAVNPSRELNKQHDVQMGLLFEQRSQSYYSLNANSLWQLMPQLVNQQFIKPDLNNPILSYDQNGVFTDSVSYNWLIDQNSQTHFDEALRSKLTNENGYHSQNAHFIDVNSISPEMLSLDMFTADELWNNGNSYVNYAGYDAFGNLHRKGRGINDFLLDKANRHIGAYNPNYTAVWLQDKFVLEKIKLRAGVRIERFDANQLVLKDKYSLYPIKTVGEVNSLSGEEVNHPSNLNDNAVIYVDDAENPNKIVGYREGSRWYNENGIEVQSAEYLRIKTTKGIIQPYLVNANQKLSNESFEDFSPEILVLPRLSFSFPINTTALFYAYYDKFAQRPNFNQSFAPINNYYFLENASNTVLPNPELKPSKRTDYQFGFKQMLGDQSILNITAGYAEVRDDINLVSVDQAYPRSYITYGNIDFSTVKSFKAEYELELPSMDLRAGYLLQFADGTGSNVNSAAALIQANQPNLRSLYPLEYDIRHKFNINATFSLDSLAKHTGRKMFKNVVISAFANTQSGTPYTAKLIAVPEAQSLGNASRSPIKGNPFGSRMPWNSTVDLSISKSMLINNKQVLTLQVSAVNLLNIQNIYNVYQYSSFANDDGYLTSPQGQQQVSNELNAQSFVNYYSLKQNNPSNFGQPRLINFTCRTTF